MAEKRHNDRQSDSFLLLGERTWVCRGASHRLWSEFDWENKVVGVTERGFLCVNRRISRLGHYEFPTDLVPFDEVDHVAISRCIGVKGLLAAAILGLAGVFAVAGLCQGAGEDWPKMAELAVAGCGGCLVLVAGARRNRICVRTGPTTYRWTSPPLAYRRTLPTCEAITLRCVEHQIDHVSYLSERFGNYG